MSESREVRRRDARPRARRGAAGRQSTDRPTDTPASSRGKGSEPATRPCLFRKRRGTGARCGRRRSAVADAGTGGVGHAPSAPPFPRHRSPGREHGSERREAPSTRGRWARGSTSSRSLEWRRSIPCSRPRDPHVDLLPTSLGGGCSGDPFQTPTWVWSKPETPSGLSRPIVPPSPSARRGGGDGDGRPQALHHTPLRTK